MSNKLIFETLQAKESKLQAKLEKLDKKYRLVRDEKSKAIQRNNDIAGLLKKYENQLRSVDLNKNLSTSFSKFNMLGEQVDDTIFKDKTLVDNVVLQDDGFYFKNHKGDLVPLDEYKGNLILFRGGGGP